MNLRFQNPSLPVLAALLFAVSTAGARTSSDVNGLATEPAVADAQVLYVGFTPPVGVAHALVKYLDQAQSEILVQAYGFTHNAIAQALVRDRKSTRLNSSHT